MELKDVVSVTGMPGLHKILGRNKNGLILESLTDGKRFGTNPRQRISILSDIAMFTEEVGISPTVNGGGNAYRNRISELVSGGVHL